MNAELGEGIFLKCSDCPAMVRLNPLTLRKGSSVREPGEPLCPSCSATRIKLVRELDKIPSNLLDIRAKRYGSGFGTPAAVMRA